jgi:putative oxidoreductase
MPTNLQNCTFLFGRLLLSVIFILSGASKIMGWNQTAEMMAGEGMVAVTFFLAASIAVELIGGLCLLLGCGTRLGATALFLFLIPVTVIFHDFWAYQGREQQEQMIHFLKNLAIMGGLLVVVGAGAGAWSVDHCCLGKSSGPTTRPLP